MGLFTRIKSHLWDSDFVLSAYFQTPADHNTLTTLYLSFHIATSAVMSLHHVSLSGIQLKKITPVFFYPSVIPSIAIPISSSCTYCPRYSDQSSTWYVDLLLNYSGDGWRGVRGASDTRLIMIHGRNTREVFMSAKLKGWEVHTKCRSHPKFV